MPAERRRTLDAHILVLAWRRWLCQPERSMEMTSTEHGGGRGLAYQPALDGVRALAVTAVRGPPITTHTTKTRALVHVRTLRAA
jgi:hypothetical protein